MSSSRFTSFGVSAERCIPSGLTFCNATCRLAEWHRLVEGINSHPMRSCPQDRRTTTPAQSGLCVSDEPQRCALGLWTADKRPCQVASSTCPARASILDVAAVQSSTLQRCKAAAAAGHRNINLCDGTWGVAVMSFPLFAGWIRFAATAVPDTAARPHGVCQ
jgi:hypothetical protein